MTDSNSTSEYHYTNSLKTEADSLPASGTKSEPTTLKTVTTASDSSSRDSGTESEYPVPTSSKDDDGRADTLPDNPNYPWGGDGPVHRHRPVISPDDQASDEAGPKRAMKRRRWDRGWTELLLNRLRPHTNQDSMKEESGDV